MKRAWTLHENGRPWTVPAQGWKAPAHEERRKPGNTMSNQAIPSVTTSTPHQESSSHAPSAPRLASRKSWPKLHKGRLDRPL